MIVAVGAGNGGTYKKGTGITALMKDKEKNRGKKHQVFL